MMGSKRSITGLSHTSFNGASNCAPEHDIYRPAREHEGHTTTCSSLAPHHHAPQCVPLACLSGGMASASERMKAERTVPATAVPT